METPLLLDVTSNVFSLSGLLSRVAQKAPARLAAAKRAAAARGASRRRVYDASAYRTPKKRIQTNSPKLARRPPPQARAHPKTRKAHRRKKVSGKVP